MVNNQDGVVHHYADEDDEAQHGEHVQRLIFDQMTHQPQTGEAPSSSQWHAEHDYKRIKKTGEEGGHKQVSDRQSQNEVPLEGSARDHQVVGSSRQVDTV